MAARSAADYPIKPEVGDILVVIREYCFATPIPIHAQVHPWPRSPAAQLPALRIPPKQRVSSPTLLSTPASRLGLATASIKANRSNL